MLNVSGFSQQISLSAFAAAIAIGTCQWSGVEIITASMSGLSRSSRKSLKTEQPLNAPAVRSLP